jgi:hypothetical protein
MRLGRRGMLCASVILLLLAVGIARPARNALRGGGRAETWTAWVSDEGCGANHTKPGGADCIRKCRRGGASIGHPEWTPQRLVLVKESDNSVWVVENPEALDGREGERVRVSVSVNGSKKSVRVKSVSTSVLSMP